MPPARPAPRPLPVRTTLRRHVIAGEQSSAARAAAATDWLDRWLPEDAPLLAARQRAAEVGLAPVEPATGAVLRLLCAVAGARTVVEVGTGTGVSALWMLRGMRREGVLTTVDSDGEHQRLARASLGEAGFPTARTRLITGRALDVLPRLSDHAYDVVFLDGPRTENEDYLDAALRLLRPGGVVAFAGALAGGKVADTSARDPETVALRELGRRVREEARLVPAVLPVGGGLLVAALA